MTGMGDHMETALAMHDELLANAPEGAKHDSAMCPFCVDWSMSAAGLPSGVSRLELADATKPYGAVEYADPGFLRDGVSRYPIDTRVHATAAWTFIHQAGVAESYTADQLSTMRTKISGALEGFGVEAETKEVEKTKALADAKNGSQEPTNAQPPTSSSKADKKPDSASEGGTNPVMDNITQETHEALLDKALRDASASLESDKAELAGQVAALTEAASAATAEIASLKSENERINGELDTAQVALKIAQDEANALKADITAKEEAALKAEVASERAGQVRNLGLFGEDYITEKSSRWADMDESAWTERLDEWKTARGAAPAATTPSTDTASAMSGSSEIPSGKDVSARRLALGLAD